MGSFSTRPAPAACALQRVPLDGGPSERIADRAGNEWVFGADADAIYIMNGESISRVEKSDHSTSSLFQAPAGQTLGARVTSDAERIYFVLFGGSVPRLMAVSKRPGSSALELGHSAALSKSPGTQPQDLGLILEMQQDENNVFVLTGGSEVLLFPKNPSNN